MTLQIKSIDRISIYDRILYRVLRLNKNIRYYYAIIDYLIPGTNYYLRVGVVNSVNEWTPIRHLLNTTPLPIQYSLEHNSLVSNTSFHK